MRHMCYTIHMENKPMFEVVTGNEKYTVVDLSTNGYSWHNDKLDAYKRMAFIKNVLGHNYRLEVR